MDDFVEYVDDLVDIVDERGVEDDDDDLDSATTYVLIVK